jgi:hypothetical protein
MILLGYERLVKVEKSEDLLVKPRKFARILTEPLGTPLGTA